MKKKNKYFLSINIYFTEVIKIEKKLIKTRIIAVFGIFLLSFPSHFIYNLFPNILFSFFFPINESIFEHLKILFTSTIIYGLFDYLLLKKEQIKVNNFSFNLFLSSTLSILIFLLLYLPIYYIIGEFLPLTLLLMILTYSLCQLISYYILSIKKIPYLNTLSILFIILIYLNFIILTFSPPKEDLFKDPITNTYGFKKEQISP